jgi:hypothetical protein
MTEALTGVLAFGYIFIVGFVLAIMLIQLLSFFAAGKMTGSINDEFMSAFTLFGALLLLSAGSTLINAVMSIFLTGFLIPAIASFVLYLGLAIFAVMRIYDLSAGKSFLFLIISLIITAVVTGGIAYGGFRFLPEGSFKLNTDAGFNLTDDADLESDFGTLPETDTDTSAEDLLLDDTDVNSDSDVILEAETETGTDTAGGPKLPTPTSSLTICTTPDDCTEPNESCINGFCSLAADAE